MVNPDLGYKLPSSTRCSLQSTVLDPTQRKTIPMSDSSGKFCVFLADERLLPPHSGGRKEMLEELAALRSEFSCFTAVPLRKSERAPHLVHHDPQLGLVFYFHQPGILRCLLRHPFDPYLASSKLPAPTDIEFLLTQLDDKHIDLVVASREGTLCLAERIRKAHPEARIILRSHNNEIRYHWHAAKSEKRFAIRARLILDAIRLRLKSSSLLEIPDVIGVISPEDSGFYQKFHAHVTYIPPVLIREADRLVGDRPSPQEPRAIFVGALDNAQSVAGLKWFVREVWPIVVDQVENATFDVIGRSPSPELERSLNALATVNLIGEVDELDPYLKNSRVVVNPSLTGSGVNIKIGTALQYDLPVVTTVSGARGIEKLRDSGLIAENAREFAEIVILLLTDDEAWKRASSLIHSIGRLFTDTVFAETLRAITQDTGRGTS